MGKLLLLLVCFGLTATGQNKFIINGELGNLSDQNVSITIRNNYVETEINKTRSVNGSFTLTGSILYPRLYTVKLLNDGTTFPLFLEPGTTTIKGNGKDLKSLKITGSEGHNEYLIYADNLIKFKTKIDNIRKSFAGMDGKSEQFRQLYQQYYAMQKDRADYIKTYFENSPGSYVAITQLPSVYNAMSELSELETVRDRFEPTLRITEEFNYFTTLINSLKKVEPGQPAPLLALHSPEGNVIRFTDYRGKYVLLDFWASWCTPCREENPKLVELYRKYHDKGLEIVGISLDSDKRKWTVAIENDKLTWPQVSDLKGWESTAAKVYVVNAIPHSVLINPEGTIISKGLRGRTLELKLSELFDN